MAAGAGGGREQLLCEARPRLSVREVLPPAARPPAMLTVGTDGSQAQEGQNKQ